MTQNTKDTNETSKEDDLTDKQYSWKDIEKYILENTSQEIFYANPNSSKPKYSVIMPPPNVTGYLHLGHALVTTIQDTIVRYKRMSGFDVLWQPGLDHAGIATQIIVEKQLKAQNIDKASLGREAFIDKVYEWKEKSGSTIIEQIKRLGSSSDFSYLAFTMDEQSVKGVNRAFVELHKAGLIYQDHRLVNWDSSLQTSVSDLEVEQKEVKGKLYYLKYYIEGSDQYITVATTRPETLFGDTAVAVNPADERYTSLVGTYVYVPIINRKIKIIADDYADLTKGTGAVKITPAHDFNDFEVGQRNSLEMLNILHPNGTLNENVPAAYQGLNVKDARKKIIVELEELGNLEKIDDYMMSVPYADRTGVVIEPYLTKQWFIDSKELAKEAIRAVKDKEIVFLPESWENLFFDWMNNIRPWNISRQLWWGHRIPVWYTENKDIIVAESEAEALAIAKEKYNTTNIRQDEDVLDTWFSSSLWPFLTLGWPENTERLKEYYPTDILVTAFDIIFFWVARMIMMGMFFMKAPPFKKVYIHALIRDEKGEKMSKSKGNVIDPIDLIDKYGTDALRFSLIAYSAQGREIRLSEKTIEGYRNFITKIWNSFKFFKSVGAYYSPAFKAENVKLPINKWIISKLDALIANSNINYNKYKLNEVASEIYQFTWKEMCDWYLELSKPIVYSTNTEQDLDKKETQETMGYIFNELLKIYHPIVPFISSYLFEQLHASKEKILALEAFPQENKHTQDFTTDAKATDNLINLITNIRSMRINLNIPHSYLLTLVIKADVLPSYIVQNLDIFKKIARVADITTMPELGKNLVQSVINNNVVGFDLNGAIDINKEIIRLQNNKAKVIAELEKINSALNNTRFVENANAETIDSYREQKDSLNSKIQNIDDILLQLETSK